MLVLLILEHYTRECEFGNFDKIKNKNNTKKHKNFWLNFCLIRSALNSSVDWVLATEGDRLFQCGIVRGVKGILQGITVCLVSEVLSTM